MRDWAKSLYPASYAGAAFWVERDVGAGGRRVVVHEFPHRDGSFNEDLGDSPRTWSVTAYLAGDTADQESAALIAALSIKGAATLVLPIDGAAQARAVKPWSRARERDRAGFIAFDLNFVAETAQPQAASPTYLATLASAGVDALAAAMAGAAGLALLTGAPGYVVQAAADIMADAIVSIDMLRASSPVQAGLSGALATQAKALFSSAPDAVSGLTGLDPAFVASLVDLARGLAAAATSPSAPSDFLTAAASAPAPLIPAATPSASATLTANAALLAALGRLALLTGAVDAALAATYASRPQAVALRNALFDRIEIEMEIAADRRAVDLMVALASLRGRTGDYFSAIMTDLAPVAIVRAPRMLPSLVLAWSLYQDISRGRDLVDRNDVAHPSFMPEQFEALAA